MEEHYNTRTEPCTGPESSYRTSLRKDIDRRTSSEKHFSTDMNSDTEAVVFVPNSRIDTDSMTKEHEIANGERWDDRDSIDMDVFPRQSTLEGEAL